MAQRTQSQASWTAATEKIRTQQVITAQPVNEELRTAPSGARHYESDRAKRVAGRRENGDARGGEGRATREYDVWKGPGAQRRRWRG